MNEEEQRAFMEKAAQVATIMAKRMKSAYVNAVARSLEHYSQEYQPSDDDFLLWVESYDWS